jgi:DNA helicase-2/ATP-dependent DNA helicase PcrA
MRTRLRALGVGGVQARTFHAAALKQLGYFWPRVVGGEPPRLVDNKFGLVANAAARARLRPAPARSATCCRSWSGRPGRWSGPTTTRPRPRGPGGRGRTTPPSWRRSTPPTAS